MQCYHIFSNSRYVYFVKNHYENYSPQMVPTNPTGLELRTLVANILFIRIKPQSLRMSMALALQAKSLALALALNLTAKSLALPWLRGNILGLVNSGLDSKSDAHG